MVTPMGFSVPMIMAIGNHESGGFSRPRSDEHYFFKYFVQEPNIVDEESRRSYHAHRLTGTTTVVVLDSNVVVRHGEQVAWLREELSRAAGRSKWALYHAPLYPIVTELSQAQSVLGRQHWGPVFDAQGLQIGFEHHDRECSRVLFFATVSEKQIFADGAKRSNPIVAGQPAASGPIYVGDGCWGVEAATPRPNLEPGLFAFVARSHHVILGQRNAANTGWDMRMVDPYGTVLDRYEVDG